MSRSDPYARTGELVRDPPRSVLGRLGYIGPGFILSASIVGSGELIATTLVGARAGFVLMWFIVFSCIVKVAVQLEFGRHAISSGESTMASLDSLPGPRLGKAGWSVWAWLALQLSKTMQVGGIGITGVRGDEILAYNYWLIEKGYAAYTGPRDESPAWAERARGWIRVMYFDAILSMLAYTVVTVLFYLLGAAVLNRLDLVPAGSALITTLGNMYTQSLGPWARDVFVIGAIVVFAAFVVCDQVYRPLVGAWSASTARQEAFVELRLGALGRTCVNAACGTPAVQRTRSPGRGPR